jgi:hypothetical protein
LEKAWQKIRTYFFDHPFFSFGLQKWEFTFLWKGEKINKFMNFQFFIYKKKTVL